MTMIDRIVPATTDADRASVEAMLGLQDAATIQTEPFSQWVIEDRFAGPRPAWEKVGAQLVDDVAAYETAKLRMLNGAHSALAYCGLQRGHAHVHEAVADPDLRALARRLMLHEAAPTIAAAPGQDLALYADQLIARFANPALQHRLIQIAMDGSQKIPSAGWRRSPPIRQWAAIAPPSWPRSPHGWGMSGRQCCHLGAGGRSTGGPAGRCIDRPQPGRSRAGAVRARRPAGGHWQPDAASLAALA